MQSLDDFALGATATRSFATRTRTRFTQLRAAARSAGAARDTFDALRRIESMRTQSRRPSTARATAPTISARACGRSRSSSKPTSAWKPRRSISTVGTRTSRSRRCIEPLMRRSAHGLAAFRQDLGARMATTTVVVMTEFGRRVAENSAFGTDHGRGGVMFVLGGGVKGGRVIGEAGRVGLWRGLAAELLEGPGDLPVFNNYRNILAPSSAGTAALPTSAKSFPISRSSRSISTADRRSSGVSPILLESIWMCAKRAAQSAGRRTGLPGGIWITASICRRRRDERAVRRPANLERDPEPQPVEAVEPPVHHEFVAEHRGLAVVDLRPHDHGISLRLRHVRRVPCRAAPRAACARFR